MNKINIPIAFVIFVHYIHKHSKEIYIQDLQPRQSSGWSADRVQGQNKETGWCAASLVWSGCYGMTTYRVQLYNIAAVSWIIKSCQAMEFIKINLAM